ncbi:MAG: hypothetical protein ABDH61_01860, partial [Acidilobaceae archaeon]
MVSPKALGLLMTASGIVGGVGYSYLVLYTEESTAIMVIKLSAAVVALLMGSVLAGVGIALLLGWRELEEEEEDEGKSKSLYRPLLPVGRRPAPEQVIFTLSQVEEGEEPLSPLDRLAALPEGGDQGSWTSGQVDRGPPPVDLY